MSATQEAVERYRARGWCTLPVHRPDLDQGACSCGRPGCAKPGKHPDARFWPDGSADPGHFAGRNLGVKLGPVSGDLADIDLDCAEAVAVGPHLLPPTNSAFGRGGLVTHALFTVPDRAAAFAKLLDPVLSGDRATIVELRWPEWDGAEQRFKNLQTVFPPSQHFSGAIIEWARDEEPARVAGAELAAAVRHVGAAVLLARYARPQERHALVLLVANLLVRAGWASDAMVVAFITAVFAARNDADKVAKIAAGEGTGAVADARKRLKGSKPMTGLSALRAMLDPALDHPTADCVVARIKEWLGVPDPPGAHTGTGPAPSGGKPGASAEPRYTPLPPWRPLPTEHLPEPVRDFVATVARAMRCDPTFVALPALAACAGMIGSTRVVRLKKSWHEPAMLWAAVVGDSGTLKTPPYKHAVAPVVAMQAAHLKAHRAAAEAHRAEVREYERLKRRSKDDDPGDPPAPPPCPRVYSRDTTIEALGGILVDNRTRFLIGRDELSGWLSSFNQYKAKGGSDLANWLELHGLGTLCVDRKTGDPKTIFVPDVGVSLCGGIQPGVLRLALTPQHFSAGVPARLLFAYPPRTPKEWTEDDIDEAAEAAYHRLIKGLAELEPHTDGDGNPYPVTLGLAPDAKAEWVRFYARFALKQSETEGELAAAFSKLEGYAARLALVHHVCQSVTAGSGALEAVTLASVRAGIALAEWFTAEAERVYQMLGEETGEQETRKLVEVVENLAACHGGRLTARHLQKSNNRRYRTSADAEAALGSLVALGLGRWEDGPVPQHGGHRARFFIPCTPHDTSDTRPDSDGPGDPNGDTGSHDTRLHGPTGLAAPSAGGGGTKPDNSSGSNRDSAARGDRVSEVSCGVQGTEHRHKADAEAGAGPPECRAVEASSVVQADTAEPHTLIGDSTGLVGVTVALNETAAPIGLDLETTGLNPARDRVRLLSLAAPAGTFLIDLFAFADPASPLAPLFAALAGREIVGHNIVAFDLPFLARLGFAPDRVFDTALASRVVYAGERADHDLATVVKRELNRDLDKSEQAGDWSRPVLTGAQLDYAATDVAVLLPLADALRAKAAARNVTNVVDLEMRCGVPVALMAATGAGFDTGSWVALADAAAARRVALAAEMDALVPKPNCLPGFGSWNWDSNTIEVPAAFKVVEVKLPDTKEETLASTDHPLARLLLDYREAAKRAGTYGRDWAAQHVTGGRVFATWNQCQAKTGRMSCSRSNLQQVPRDPAYRRCFTARPGRVLVKCDFSQIELRIAAKVTGDTRMLAAYRAGEDLHTVTAAKFLGAAVSEVTKEARQMAKPVNFGAIYGLGPRSLRLKARADYGKDMTEKQARGFLDAFFAQFPGVRAWHNRLKRDRTTEVRTLGGRRIAVEPDQFFGAKANYVVQGTGGDGLKRALVLLWERRAECPSAEVVLAVHDEIVLEVPETEADTAKGWLARCMVDGMAPLIDPVPVEVEVKVGATWAG